MRTRSESLGANCCERFDDRGYNGLFGTTSSGGGANGSASAFVVITRKKAAGERGGDALSDVRGSRGPSSPESDFESTDAASWS